MAVVVFLERTAKPHAAMHCARPCVTQSVSSVRADDNFTKQRLHRGRRWSSPGVADKSIEIPFHFKNFF